MTLEKALDTVSVRKNELERVSIEGIDEVIDITEREANRFPYDKFIREKLEAYKAIKEYMKEGQHVY